MWPRTPLCSGCHSCPGLHPGSSSGGSKCHISINSFPRKEVCLQGGMGPWGVSSSLLVSGPHTAPHGPAHASRCPAFGPSVAPLGGGQPLLCPSCCPLHAPAGHNRQRGSLLVPRGAEEGCSWGHRAHPTGEQSAGGP